MNKKYPLKIQEIIDKLGNRSTVVAKQIIIGTNNTKAILLMINGLYDDDTLNRDILNPLLCNINEEISPESVDIEYICQKYIPISDLEITNCPEKILYEVNLGKTALFIDGYDNTIILNTIGGYYRNISDPINESSIKGTREGFVENIQTNMTILKRIIKDKNLTSESFIVGKRSKTTVVIMYIDDIAEGDIVDEVRNRINAIDTDIVSATIEQYIQDTPYTIFPQVFGTERPDVVASTLLEGHVAILLNGSQYVLTVPALFIEFFQTVEDYNQRSIVSSFTRLMRMMAVLTVVLLPSLYLSLIRYNVELIPIKFINPIVQSREGIALSPFLEILLMEIVTTFLHEGGLRLPPRIATTLSIVGGIIIGSTAIESKIVSPTTLLIIGITTISTFLIPNYEMSLSIRFLRFPMLLLANTLGPLGISVGCCFIIYHLLSLTSFTVPYLTFNLSDQKDIFVRAPIETFNNRPQSMPSKETSRQQKKDGGQ